MYLTVGILLVIGIVAALLVVGRGSKDVEDAFAMNQDEVDFQSEAFAASTEPAKELPQIEEATQAETSEAQQWEENGVHWSQAADGTLSYWDEEVRAGKFTINDTGQSLEKSSKNSQINS